MASNTGEQRPDVVRSDAFMEMFRPLFQARIDELEELARGSGELPLPANLFSGTEK